METPAQFGGGGEKALGTPTGPMFEGKNLGSPAWQKKRRNPAPSYGSFRVGGKLNKMKLPRLWPWAGPYWALRVPSDGLEVGLECHRGPVDWEGLGPGPRERFPGFPGSSPRGIAANRGLASVRSVFLEIQKGAEGPVWKAAQKSLILGAQGPGGGWKRPEHPGIGPKLVQGGFWGKRGGETAGPPWVGPG